MEGTAGAKVQLEDYGPLKLRAGQSSQSQTIRLELESGTEGLGFCHRTTGSHARCVNRGTAQLTQGGGVSGQNLELTWAPPPAATPRSGTNSLQPPAIPAAQPTYCLSCGLWPPCKQRAVSVRLGRLRQHLAAVKQHGLHTPKWPSSSS